MRPQRIKTGFHRLGIAVAAFFLVLAVSLVGLTQLSGGRPSQGLVNLVWSSGLIALLAYPVARAIAWIVTGFMGDGEGTGAA